ncbi:hypothetical protein [Ectothiorhodospira lacustris]|uniref:hypothetical protein n=1 Tax=Ectothiorhodospira lacustris TaxID=2899127 RepID=UPI001EE996CC|nr:hypothetical protein [Ectothiorhodospira lacustris]MCG5501385.1 hypothetical protein [Ectothiorhodospira lacustris]MCG5510159.1 hypothetical protein [Ectothiorhodospira lacustris]MCG5522002.1 hypothetical protein [Ectothiorhodospira lacustris]
MQQNERSDIIVRAGGGAAMVVAALLMAGCSQKVSDEGFFGVWTVEGFTTTEDAALTEEETQALVGRNGVYSKHIAHFEDIQCLKPGYVVHALEPEAFVEHYGITPQALGFPEGEVTTVEITCFDTPLEEPMSLLLKGEETLITAWNGVFFEARRKTGAPLSAR